LQAEARNPLAKADMCEQVDKVTDGTCSSLKQAQDCKKLQRAIVMRWCLEG
jgi:hypothetical protein